MPVREDRAGSQWWPPLTWVAVAVVAAAYLPVLSALQALWSGDKYYAYLGLVPPVFALLMWASRGRRTTIAGRRSGLGGIVLLVALLVLVLGHAVASLQVQSLSLVVAVIGGAVWLRGVQWTRAAAYPLAFLLFLVPVPRSVFDAVTLDIQRFLTRNVGALLDAAGVPVRMEELAIHLPSVTLQIVEACNGLRFLMGFMVLIVAAVGLLVPSVPRRIAVVALAVPMAMAANVVRITALGLVAYWFGPDAVKGPFHDLIGRAVWAMTVLSLFLLAWNLGRPASVRRPLGQRVGVPS